MRTACGVSVGVAILVAACQGPVKDKERITEVTRNLLPPTRIAGEAPMVLEERAAFHGVPGFSIAVVDDFKLQWTHNFGVVSDQEPVSVSDPTLFAVGSLSKAVTAATVLSMVEDGLIELDLDINEQLKSWQVPDNDFTADEAVTPRRLLNHTGGVAFSPPASYSSDRMPSTLQLLNGVEPARSPPVVVDRVPGTEFLYSNAGFTILRLLIEERSGKPYAEVVEERIFEPLGLKNSSVEAPLPGHLIDHVAWGHNGDGNHVFEDHRWIGHSAAGGVWTTAADYAAFVLELQKALAGRSDTIISKDLADEMTCPHDSERYGLGVFLHKRSGSRQYFSHIGDGLGFVGGFAAHPTEGKAAVVLTNGVGGIHLVREIMAAVAQVYDWPDYLDPERQPVPLSDGELKQIVGRYRSGFDGLVEIQVQGDELWLRGVTKDDVRLFHLGDDVFVCSQRAGDLRIVRDTDGGVNGLSDGIADELGRLPDPPKRADRLGGGDVTPLEMLQGDQREKGMNLYRALYRDDPEHPAVSVNRLNGLGYTILEASPPAAVAIFELNVEFRPTCANCFDSLGEGYLEAGDVQRSVRSYRRSLELDPGNDNARKMLAKIGASR